MTGDKSDGEGAGESGYASPPCYMHEVDPAYFGLPGSPDRAERSETMALLGKAVLFVWNNYTGDDEDAFNEWYIREHVPERVRIPGFLRGRRYEAVSGTRKYGAFYEVADPGVLVSDIYMHFTRNPDANSRHFIGRFGDGVRAVMNVVASSGAGSGSAVSFLGFGVAGEREAELRKWAVGTLLPELVKSRGIVGAHLLATDRKTLATSQRIHLRPEDTAFDRVLIVEATRPEELDAVRETLLAPAALAEKGIVREEAYGVLRLLYTLSAV
jgi:hypothetical protein